MAAHTQSRLKRFLRRHLSQNQINFYHRWEAVFWSLRYGFPARGMTIVGVTGTKGKTTTVHFTASILEEAGHTVGVMSTVHFQIGDQRFPNETHRSVLRPSLLQKLLRDMRRAGCTAVVMEVTSHALEQHRIWGIPFTSVGFTNLGHDHLDYHKTIEAYRNAKLLLFQWQSLKAAVANCDDPTGSFFLENTTATRRWSCSTESPEADPHATDHLFADKISANSANASFTLTVDEVSERIRLQIPGRFNIENALIAAGLGLSLNIGLGTIAAGLSKLERVPGRLEKIETRKGFTIIVDFAHSSDSLERLYSTLRPDVRGRIIAVLGACGNRDKTERPIMGALAARFCDLVYLTDDEPYEENPTTLIEDIARGVPRGRALFRPSREQLIKREKPPVLKKPESESGEGIWWWKVPDRRTAIATAIKQARLDDVVLITGMGAHTSRMIGTTAVPWNERQVVEDILTELNLSPLP